MGTVCTEFVVPCTQDKATIAVQDTIDRLGWPVLEVSESRMVVTCPGLGIQAVNLPKLTAELGESESGTATHVFVWVSTVGLLLGNKKRLSGLMGQFVNSVSLRVQTNSIAINPTVAVGEGQGGPSPSTNDRLSQLERLMGLLRSGVLTDEEFQNEKQTILGRPESALGAWTPLATASSWPPPS
jgi:hypothetical protein